MPNTSMRIGVDIRSLMDRQYSGVNMYAFNLLDALFRVDKENEYVLFWNGFCDPFAKRKDGINNGKKCGKSPSFNSAPLRSGQATHTKNLVWRQALTPLSGCLKSVIPSGAKRSRELVPSLSREIPLARERLILAKEIPPLPLDSLRSLGVGRDDKKSFLDSLLWERGELKCSRIPNKIFNASVTFLGWPKIDKLAAGGANRRGFFDEIGRSVEKSPPAPLYKRGENAPPIPPAPLYKRGESKKIDLFFSPNLLFSAFSKDCKKVLTVHDLSFERCPQFYSLKGRLWHKLVRCRKMCESSDMIVAVSENTKYDIMELYGIPEEKIRVVYPGFGNVRGCEGVNWTNRTDKTYHLPQRYILFVGNVEARKNVGGIIEAFRILNEEYGISDYDLVIAGKVRNKEIKKLRNLGMTEEVKNKMKIIGYIDEEMKVYLYRNADLFVYPSFYEGFGFPPLEAMSCGVPVVTSDSSSLPEVVGDAGIKVDPHNARDIARAMAEILRDKDLRDLLVKKGYERIKKFSWEKSARKVLEIFNELGEN